jgi:hypothetical protein
MTRRTRPAGTRSLCRRPRATGSETLSWRLTMYPTVHSFRASGGGIASAEA